MSTKTTTYGLTKPAGTDYYSVDVQNNNMDIIDSQLKAEQDAISEINDNLAHWMNAAQALNYSNVDLNNLPVVTYVAGTYNGMFVYHLNNAYNASTNYNLPITLTTGTYREFFIIEFGIAYTNQWRFQIYVPISADDGVYIRNQFGTSWSAWRKITAV